MTKLKNIELCFSTLESPIGKLYLVCTKTSLANLSIKKPPVPPADFSKLQKAQPENAAMKKVKKQLKEYFDGKRKSWDFPLEPLTFSCSLNDDKKPRNILKNNFTEILKLHYSKGFYAEARRACKKIQYGKTASYKDLAKQTSNPKAMRAVGTAMATNPISIVVPCHRVVRSNGELGNYDGGKNIKRWLLNHEYECVKASL